MSPKKPPDFAKADPSGEGLRRVFVNYAQTAPLAEQVGMGNAIRRGARLAPDNRKGTLGPLAKHMLKVMNDNRAATKPAEIIALAKRADPKIKSKDDDTLRKAIRRAKTHRDLSRR